MASIDEFKVTNDLSSLTIELSAAATKIISTLVLWTQDTFKDTSKSIDFSSKLAQIGNTESITITASELGTSLLEGMYFIEITSTEDNDVPVLGVATDFTRFQICITEILCKVASQCVYCDHELHKALTYKMYIDSLRSTMLEGRYTLAIGFWNNLNRVCSPTCKACCDLSELAKKGLGFYTVNNELFLY